MEFYDDKELSTFKGVLFYGYVVFLVTGADSSLDYSGFVYNTYPGCPKMYILMNLS